MRENLTTGDVPFRKAYLGSLIDRIEVGKGEVRIVGRKEMLERAVLASRQGQAGVHSFVCYCNCSVNCPGRWSV